MKQDRKGSWMVPLMRIGMRLSLGGRRGGRTFTGGFSVVLGAVYEGVNECQAGNSPPDTGGVAAPSRRRCEATAAAQTGWLGLTKCFRMHF